MGILQVVLLILSLGVGGGAGFFIRTQQLKEEEQKKRQKQEKELQSAKNKAGEIVLKAKSEAIRAHEESKRDERANRRKLQESEERLLKKEQTLDEKTEGLDKLKAQLEEKSDGLKLDREKAKKALSEQETKLQEIAALTPDQAKELLLKQIESEFKDDLVHYAKKLEADVRAEVDEKAKTLLAEAIQRYASETTVESTTTSVTLPADDMKGRIIGREGRNINAFETVTGVDVIVDDTPGNIIISGFDPIRRYVAKITLERLVEDGRIHPARIEETYVKVKEEVNMLIKELGEKASFELGVAGLQPNLLKILGRLRFRIAYGQNVLKHSREVAFLAAELAGLIGANVDTCKKAGLLHDIGKAVDHEVQGKHAFIGRDILKKFGLSKEVLHCVEANEADVEATTLEAKIVQVANLISVSRPGANKQNLDQFIKRLTEIETLAKDFSGVTQAFAVQAGRELRVFVDPENVDDLQAIKLSHSIARKIEKQLQYPGKIKVEVIRDLRLESFAE
ncbi:MAG: ribonuclease Y [Oceanicoccus sp.]|jgi:ribonuclease Y